jgi:beta-glucosidase
MFDPADQVSYARIPFSVVDSPAHRALALEVARQSLVLLKNQDDLLPLDKSGLKSIAVIGPNADETLVLTGNYMGTPAEPVSVLAGIRALVSPGTEVNYARGCEILSSSRDGFEAAIQAVKKSQVAVLVAGLSQQMEGEQGQQEGNPEGVTSLGDRITLDLPPIQEDFIKAIHATGTPIILVLMNGSAVSINWADAHVPAILEAWYPGQAGGTAIAEALFGLTNPGGRLPVTFYQSASDLPAFDNYSMENRTYRYFTGQPLYPFGFGLSYTTFAYRNLQIGPAQVNPGDPVSVQVEVENTGDLPGDEVVQLYLKDAQASLPVPRLSLQGFTRLHLSPGEKQTVQFSLNARQMSFADESGKWVLEPGLFKIWVGGQQPDEGAASQPDNLTEGQFTVQA